MSIREIEAFRAVMTAGTASKAARLLGVSQPAISQSIRKLEALAGLRLFERVRGRLQPTQEAMALMSEVDRYFIGYEAIEHRIRSLRLFGLGRLSIASYPALGNCFLARAIASFAPEQRKMQMMLQVTSSKEVYQHVASGQVDFGLLNDEVNTHGVESSSFSVLPGVIAMSPHHPLRNKRTLQLEDLATDHFIDMNPEDSARRRLETALTERQVQLRSIVETPLSATACELALSGIGLAMVHPIAALDFVPKGLVIRRLSMDIECRTLLAFRPGRPISENGKEFLRCLRMQLEKETEQVNLALDRKAR
ncbi:LysR substrate-binding domain-containing protein [Paraburkholderia sp. BCC1884]|uniref:LysR substrate-binding domain-containing protein n=1 Tax=Paraburkholderia sp. BCC1884 TaxID=2562668 RepID=UPI001183A046|nr:LysR substrate-binding domain-containing protein [Paraburkholderia sp. BCC1884]